MLSGLPQAGEQMQGSSGPAGVQLELLVTGMVKHLQARSCRRSAACRCSWRAAPAVLQRLQRAELNGPMWGSDGWT